MLEGQCIYTEKGGEPHKGPLLYVRSAIYDRKACLVYYIQEKNWSVETHQ